MNSAKLNRKRILLRTLLLLGFLTALVGLTGCEVTLHIGGSDFHLGPTQPVQPTYTPAATLTAQPTYTPRPTYTLLPTYTFLPVFSLTPSPTP